MPDPGRLGRRAAHYLIRGYQLSFSLLLGRQCRYMPSCSAYTDEAIGRHGLGPGAVMGLARICRCHPWGNHGFDPVPEDLPAGSSWLRPWRYGDWRGPLHCEDLAARDVTEKAPDSPAQQATIRGLHEENALKQEDRARF